MLLIPKGTTDKRDIDLLDTLWKVVEVLVDTCLRASLQMHNTLHGLRDRIGTGTAIMELNISQ